MTMTFYLDTVMGAVMANRVVLGFALAGIVILIEAFVLYKLGWAVDLTTSSVANSQTTVSVQSPSRQFILCLRDSFIANIASTLVGWLVSEYLLFLNFWSISFWITAFVITIAVESLILWALRRKSVVRSGVAALAMNAASYFILIVFFGLIYELGLASRI